MKFKTEYEMSESFQEFINQNFNRDNIYISKEQKGLFGIPDFILIDTFKNNINEIISIELKLKNWQRALTQAFRYKSFSNISYVIMDEGFIAPAIKNLDEFKHFNIGLGSFNANLELVTYFNPKFSNPFSLEKYIPVIESIIQDESEIGSRLSYIEELADNFLSTRLSNFEISFS